MKPKYPAILFYCGDWLKDPRLSSCSPAARGVWLDLICAIHENNNSGEICGTCSQLARMARCTEKEMESALVEIRNTETGIVAQHNGIITVICRRMRREFNNRKNNRIRQQRYQRKRSNNGEITPIDTDMYCTERGAGERNPLNNGQLEVFNSLKESVCSLFGRPKDDPLSEIEMRSMMEVARRPNALIEFMTIESYRENLNGDGRGQFFPHCLGRLLEEWGGVLDKARGFRPTSHSSGLSVRDQVKALEEEISKHPANRESVFHDKNATELQRNDLRAKRQRLKELKGVG